MHANDPFSHLDEPPFVISDGKVISVADEGKKALIKLAPMIFSIGSILLASGKVSAEQGYLTEPTADFKAEEARTASLKKEEIKIRKDWDAIIDRFVASNEPKETAAALHDLNEFLKPLNGIPSGVKKRALVKICRKKKFRDTAKLRGILPTWTTECEIEYENLIRTFNIKTAPESVSIYAIFLFGSVLFCTPTSKIWYIDGINVYAHFHLQYW